MKTLITIIRSVVALAGVAGRNSLSIQFMKTNFNLLTLGVLLSLAGASFGQPVITTQPQSGTNVAGTTAAFWVAATGTPPLAYQWQKLSGTWSDLAGSTDTNLSLSNVQTGQAGDYRVVITNVDGALTSDVAHLYVIVPPVITSQPVDQAVALGTAASFIVGVTGTAPLSYQWRQDGVDQAGATTRTFIRSSAQLTNAGGYAVVVTNLAGAVTSRVAQLSVALGRVYTNAQGAQLAYRLFAPVNYDPAKTYPLVLFWHGGGEQGTDNLAQLTDFGQFIFLSASNQVKHPCFYLLPQAPIVECEYFREPGGMFEQAMELLNLLQVEFNIDPDRLYITGYSMGGAVTWGMVARFPSVFAAAVPTAGGWACTNSVHVPLGSYLNIRVPVWGFHAANDSTVNVQQSDYAVSSLRSLGGNPIYTRYQSGGHGIPQTAYSTPGLVDWVMAQKRGMPSTNPPLVTITTPTAAASYVTALSALDLAGTAAHYTNVLRVTWTNTVNQAGGTATGTNNWSVTGIPLQVAATNLIVITAWATNNITGFRGDTTFNTALAVVSWPIRATLTLEGTSALLNWTGGGAPYRVQRATDLIAGDWTDFLPDATPPVSLPLDGTAGFYRIIGR